MGTESPPPGSSRKRRHSEADLNRWWKSLNGRPHTIPGQVFKDPHAAAGIAERFRRWVRSRPTGRLPGPSSAETGAGGKGPASSGAPSMAELWANSKGMNFNYNRYMTRAELNKLQRSIDSVKESAKRNEITTGMIRSEQDRIKLIVEGLAKHLKMGLNSEVASLKMTPESASELTALINGLKDGLNKTRPAKRFSLKRLEEYFKAPRRCADLYSDLQFYIYVVTAGLVLKGYLLPKFSEATPFNSRETPAGDLLFNGYQFGLQICTSHQFGQNFISSLLSGNVEALQSNILFKHIRDRWSAQIDILPGHDVVLRGTIKKFWLGNLKFSLDLPYNGDRKLGFLQTYKYGSLGGSIGLTANPILNLCTLFGSKKVNGGCIIDYETVPGTIRRIAMGGALNADNFSLAAMLDTQFEENEGGHVRRMTPSCTAYYKVTEATSLAAQVVHQAEDHHTTYMAGLLHVLNSSTTVKGLLTNDWVLSSHIKHKFSICSVSLCSQFDLKVPQEAPRIGVSFSIGK